MNLPTLNFSGDDNNLFTKRNIIALVVLVVLAVAIPIGLRLVQQQQQLRSRASTTTGGVQFVQDGNTTCDPDRNCTTTSDTVQIQLNPPTSW